MFFSCLKSLFTIFLFIVFTCSRAMCWGHEGHEVVVRMAYQMIADESPQAADSIRAILGKRYFPNNRPDFDAIGNWADRHKSALTRKWHFVDISQSHCHYNAERDCENGNCIIEALKRQQARILDRSLPLRERRKALLYWFHLCGDLYQPFHCIEKQHGGNDLPVTFYGKSCNLHEVWDSKMIEKRQPNPVKLSSEIMDTTSWSGHKTAGYSYVDFVAAAEEYGCPRAEKASKGFRKDRIEKLAGEYIKRWWPTVKSCLWEGACLASGIGEMLTNHAGTQ